MDEPFSALDEQNKLAPAGGAAAHLGGAQEDRCLHHPQRRRGGVPWRPDPGDDRAPGQVKTFVEVPLRAPAQRHRAAEDAGIRRAGHAIWASCATRSTAPGSSEEEMHSMSVQTISTGPRSAGRMSARTRDRLLNVISPLGLLLVWELLRALRLHRYAIFSGAVERGRDLRRDARHRRAVTHTAISLQRLAYGAIARRPPGARPRHRDGTLSARCERCAIRSSRRPIRTEERHSAAGAADFRARRGARRSSWSRSACSFRW